MPELPEVEIIARSLQLGGRGQKSIPGRRIHSAQLFWARTLAEPGRTEFLKRLPGQRVEEVTRRGSGDLRVAQGTENLIPQPHDRLSINFNEECSLFFHDTRKFGRVWLVSDPQTILGSLGPEPLDTTFTAEQFHTMLTKRKRQLKPFETVAPGPDLPGWVGKHLHG